MSDSVRHPCQTVGAAMADKRVTMTVKLRPGKDDDLIAWWQSLEPGNFETDGKQSIIKAVLRAGLELPQPHVETNGELDPLTLDEIRQQLYQEWEQWTQQLIDSLPGYVQNEVEQRLNTPRPVAAPPPVEAADQIDQQTAMERKNRLSKANW